MISGRETGHGRRGRDLLGLGESWMSRKLGKEEPQEVLRGRGRGERRGARRAIGRGR